MITSVEKFKASSIREVEIPGGYDGEMFTIAIKPASMLSLIAKGKIPNSLMETAKGLFDTKQVDNIHDAEKLIEEQGLDFESIVTMSKLMDAVCDAVMYQPTFKEVEEYLTDEQKQAIFDYSQVGVDALTPSNKE